MLGLAEVDVKHAQAADQHRYLGRGQGQQVSAVEQQLGRGGFKPRAHVVAKAVRRRFQRRERVHVGLRLGGVHATRREGHLDVDACLSGCGLDGGGAAQYDQIGQRDFLAAGLRGVK